MDSSVSPKDEIWFLRVCLHISNAVYKELMLRAIAVPAVGRMEKTSRTWTVVHIQRYIAYVFIIISNIVGIGLCVCVR